MLTQEIRVSPSGLGFVVSHTWGKTLRSGDTNSLVIPSCQNLLLCPVFALEQYIQGAKKIGVDLATGYLFRPVTNGGRVLCSPLSYSVTYERLKYYLNILHIDEGETPHSLRGGCAITLARTGDSCTRETVMDHVGWRSSKSLDRYTRLPKLLANTPLSAARVLANLADHSDKGGRIIGPGTPRGDSCSVVNTGDMKSAF